MQRSGPAVPNFMTLATEVNNYLTDDCIGNSLGSIILGSECIHKTYRYALIPQQNNQICYPTLYSMAMNILPIQATSVPCKRVFSSAKETITPRCNHLMPDIMEACQMVKYTLKAQDKLLNFTCHLTDEAVETEMIDADKFFVRLPEDLDEYHMTGQKKD